MLLLRPLGVALLTATVVTATSSAVLAQQTTEERASLEQKKADKLAEPWLRHVDWALDLDTAMQRARETGKPIFAYFTRSYAP